MLTSAVLLTSPGCLMAATAPMRMERRERAEAAFKKLAELNPDQIARFFDERMTTQLVLTDQQRPRISELNRDHARRLHDIAASDASIRAKAKAMKEQNDAHESALKSVLTPDQFTRFQATKEEMREALKNFRSGK